MPLKNSYAWVAICMLLASLYAIFIEPNWIEVSHVKLGEVGDGKRVKVLLLSDMHLSDFGYRERRVLKLAEELQPDIVVLSGDIVEAPDELVILDKFLTSLVGDIKVAVLGNWEHWGGIDLQALRRIYEERGVKLLVNEIGEYRVGDDRTLTIVGTDDFTGSKPDINVLEQIKNSNSTTLVVQHSPEWFDQTEVQVLKTRINLCLSGHTHGGQVTFFGIPIWTPRGSGGYVAGLYKTSLCPLYVSRGIGTSIAPIRFFSKPEITLIEI